MSEKPGDHETSFEERLAVARDKRGLDAVRSGPGKTPDGLDGNALAMGLRVGLEMVSALVVAVAIGWGLDRLLGTKPILLAVFVLLGGAAGVLNVWRLYAPKRGVAPGRDGSVEDAGAEDRGAMDRRAGDRRAEGVGDKDRGL